MKPLILISLALALVPLAQAEEQATHILVNTPYSESHDIRNNILNECTSLGTKLSSFTQSYANARGIEIVLEIGRAHV